jgi:hypothetical protein
LTFGQRPCGVQPRPFLRAATVADAFVVLLPKWALHAFVLPVPFVQVDPPPECLYLASPRVQVSVGFDPILVLDHHCLMLPSYDRAWAPLPLEFNPNRSSVSQPLRRALGELVCAPSCTLLSLLVFGTASHLLCGFHLYYSVPEKAYGRPFFHAIRVSQVQSRLTFVIRPFHRGNSGWVPSAWYPHVIPLPANP